MQQLGHQTVGLGVTGVEPARSNPMSRRLFILAAILAVLVISALVLVSILSWGGASLQSVIHPVAEASAGFLATVAALLAMLRSRGRRAVAWGCWSAYTLSLAVGS